MFEQAFKRIDDVLREDSGSSTELDYIEQTSWLLFLKYLDALETERAQIAELHNQKHAFLLEESFRWHSWAMPLTSSGTLDHNRALVGDDLRDFVDQRLFPYLRGFKQRAERPDTIEYKVGEIFGELKNKFNSGYSLRSAIEVVETLRFNFQTEKHELSELYEAKIKNMGNAGRNGGEYYTPRPLIRAILEVVNPQIGETVYDGALGSGARTELRSVSARLLRSHHH
jgi:type I restriction enzyme M protein